MRRALRRAFLLGRGNWQKVLGILAFEYCLTWSVSLALATPLIFAAILRGFRFTTESMEKAATAAGVLLEFGSICSAPIALLAFSMLYLDSRVRKEGFDIQYLLNIRPSIEDRLPSARTQMD